MSKKVWLVVILMVVSLFSTGCLSMMHYPSRVVDDGGICMGLGTDVGMSLYEKGSLNMMNSLFVQVGIGHGIDCGVDLMLYKFIPCVQILSIRKQFDFNAVVIDGITLDAGATLSFDRIYGSASLLKKGFSLTITCSKNIFKDSDDDDWFINSIYGRLAYEYLFKNRFIVMPFVTCGRSKTDIISDIQAGNYIGAGISITYKTK